MGDLEPSGQRAGADSGDPQLRTLSAESGTEAQVGIWECEPGGWPIVNRRDTETCYIISGRARITDDATGRVVEVGAGDFVILPRGWSGRWDVIETTRKAYTVF
ncbi:cupin domain-containing protein [Mycolicibacterium baixiangningiae]|uniref:cupin domain-containing protein n=1 Tax=Mycolicibacterium baixiangningiae TaxID=2761578 RepID=UPI001E49827F|nr:cupin domain-containing protein [Mycolicibacterium baixiangningiae]